MFKTQNPFLYSSNNKNKENCTLILNLEEKTVIKQKKETQSLFSLSTNCKTFTSSNDKNNERLTPRFIRTPLQSYVKPVIIPFKVSESEQYSLLKIKKVKSEKFSPYKTTSRLFSTNKKYDCDEFTEENKENYYPLINKKKKIHSVKKEFSSHISFNNERLKAKKNFMIYRDNDIGIAEEWQKFLITNFNDDDIESDSEEIEKGVQLCFTQLSQAIIQKRNQK